MAAPMVDNVVADAVVFMRNVQVQEFCKNIFTIREVASEIKDAATRRRLAVLPYELKFREPTPESIKIVTEFSKKTGDYVSLSAVDIQVMALTYQLEKQFVGTDHIKQAPSGNVEVTSSTVNLDNPTQIAGFYLPKNDVHVEKCKDDDELIVKFDEVSLTENQPESPDQSTNIQSETDPPEILPVQNEQSQNSDIGEEIVSEDAGEGSDEGFSDIDGDGEGDDSDGGGWITPNNIASIRSKMSADKYTECADVQVACVTSDFAMQNVLIQMGLNVLSVNGMLIKQAKTYVLQCHACMKTTKEMDRVFCHWCGNKTLTKIAYSLNQDGTVSYHYSRRKPISTRGMKHSIPTPKGGKHSQNAILCEDQTGCNVRTSRLSRHKTDPLDPDYDSRSSPFAVRDVYSKAFQLGLKSGKSDSNNWRSRRNLNETARKTGNKKKKSVY